MGRQVSLSDDDFRYVLSGSRPSLDLDWFAIDRLGNIAGFTTAGFAEFPRLVLRDRVALNRVYTVFAAIPIVGDAVWLREPPPCGDTWTNWARRGLFGYNWDHCIGHPARLPYRIQCRPTVPITLSDLPEDVSAWLAPISFPAIVFADSPEISVYEHFHETI
jgi:hypothetical protein